VAAVGSCLYSSYGSSGTVSCWEIGRPSDLRTRACWGSPASLGYAAHCYTWTAWWHVGAPAEEAVTYEEVDSSFAAVDEAKCQAEKSMENSLNHWSGIEKYPL
jgi:hypothetical protein